MSGTGTADNTLAKVREAMAGGARLDVVRLFFNPTHAWGVHVYAHGTTPGGRDKWTKVILILPNDGENVADVLHLLGQMAEDASKEAALATVRGTDTEAAEHG